MKSEVANEKNEKEAPSDNMPKLNIPTVPSCLVAAGIEGNLAKIERALIDA